MIHPIKALKTEINANVACLRVLYDAYKYERMILDSQAKLGETTLVPGYTNIYA
jgi:hypothetical protein